MKRFLITTPLEETWKKSEPVLFLGEWCLTYPRKLSDLNMDAEVMPYHWNDRKKMFEDYQYIDSLYEVTLKKLSQKLNELHGVDHSVRYWRILVGPWLGLFMLMLFDRWSSISQAVNDYDVSGSIVLVGSEERLVPNDMNEFDALYHRDDWNHHIYARILEQFPSIEIESHQQVIFPDVKKSLLQRSTKAKIKRLLRSLFSRVGSIFSNEEEASFLLTYLTRWEEVNLSAQFGQFPRLFVPPTVLKVETDFSQRQWVLDEEKGVGFEDCLSALIPQQIPNVYLEGYKPLVHQAETRPWPKRPKAIWTSNITSDDVFKVWAADKAESGSPLLIGQHGGNYGMGLWNWNEQHEIEISDRYLTWGWSQPSNPKLAPVGKIKYSRPVKELPDQGSAVLVTVMVQRYGNPALSMYTSSQWLQYLQNQFDFVAALPVSIQKKLIVRLSQPDYGWHQVDRWRDRFSTIQIDDGSSDMNRLMRNSRLNISTYNATTYLESLSMNVPTVIHWDPDYMETNDWAQPYFDDLRTVGIFHETPQSAAHHVTRVWDDVAAWWEDDETRLVRDRFVREFAHCPEDKIGRLKNAINEVIGQC